MHAPRRRVSLAPAAGRRQALSGSWATSADDGTVAGHSHDGTGTVHLLYTRRGSNTQGMPKPGRVTCAPLARMHSGRDGPPADRNISVARVENGPRNRRACTPSADCVPSFLRASNPRSGTPGLAVCCRGGEVALQALPALVVSLFQVGRLQRAGGQPRRVVPAGQKKGVPPRQSEACPQAGVPYDELFLLHPPTIPHTRPTKAQASARAARTSQT